MNNDMRYLAERVIGRLTQAMNTLRDQQQAALITRNIDLATQCAFQAEALSGAVDVVKEQLKQAEENDA